MELLLRRLLKILHVLFIKLHARVDAAEQYLLLKSQPNTRAKATVKTPQGSRITPHDLISPRKESKTLARIFHTDSSRGAVNPDVDKEGDGLRQRLYVSYCPRSNSKLTQYPLSVRKPQQNRYEICGLSPLHAFSRTDRYIALFSIGVALVTFWSTVMPNVGLGDDGEMAIAALHCGVPHPSGYPLWTMSAGLFSKLIPFGNASWKLNLFSGLCASLAVGLVALLSRSSSRWLGLNKNAASFLALTTSLTFAWSVPVWSQATIGKGTYSLHVLLMLMLATLCYLWIRTPSWRNAFVWIVFSFSLGMSNHHMTLAMAALPLLVILLLHRPLFWEYTIYSLLIGSLLYLGFAYLSSTPEVMKSAIRFFYTTATAFLLLLCSKKKFTEWRQGFLLVIVVILGLLPYLYMPLASSTNPPMNWSYTSTREGFFYAINRSQYWGTLANHLQGTIGKAMGIPPAQKPQEGRIQTESKLQLFIGFFQRFWMVLFKNISPLPLLLIAAMLFFLARQVREQQIWFTLLVIGFLLAAFFEPIMAPSGYDNPVWDMQKPWQGLGYGFLLLLASYSTSVLIVVLRLKIRPITSILLFLCGMVTIYTFLIGLPRSSQKNHWFGWMFGHDMLVDLPPNSFVFGGTDPGRFIPTYMIFGESFQDPRCKRDPTFDRRDLYIITQNALADVYYNQYIRSQYTDERPSTFHWIERFLGRDQTYPKENLILPHSEEITAIYQKLVQQVQDNSQLANLQTNSSPLNTAIAEWIFLRNRDHHHFFVEESFPMPWSYPYAIPHGLCYEINHDPLPQLSGDIVAKDREFWTHYINRLRNMKGFEHDEVAQHSFAKLRNTTGNIYAFRHMSRDAEFAYKQALDLWPGNCETVENMMNLLSQQERFQEADALVTSSLLIDPNSPALKKMKEMTEIRLKSSKEAPLLEQRFNAEPKNRPLFIKLVQDYINIGNHTKVDQLISNVIVESPQDPKLLRDMINLYVMQKNIPQALAIADLLSKVQPDQWDVLFAKAKYLLILKKKDEAIFNLQQGIKIGGQVALQQLFHEPIFQQLTNEPAFQQFLCTQQKS